MATEFYTFSGGGEKEMHIEKLGMPV